MNVYEGNDLRDALNYHNYRSERRDGAARASPSEEEKPSHPTAKTARGRVYYALRDSMAGRYSYALNLLLVSTRVSYQTLKIWFGPSSNKKAKHRDGKDAIDFRYILDFGDKEVPFNIENTDSDEVIHARALRRGTVKLADVFDEALRDFVGLSHDKGFTPVVTYSPSAYTAYAEYVRFADPDLEPIMRAYSKMQRDYFSYSAGRFGYHFIDLTPELQDRQGNCAPMNSSISRPTYTIPPPDTGSWPRQSPVP